MVERFTSLLSVLVVLAAETSGSANCWGGNDIYVCFSDAQTVAGMTDMKLPSLGIRREDITYPLDVP